MKSVLSLLQCYLRVAHSRVSIPELLLILFNSVRSKLDIIPPIRAVDLTLLRRYKYYRKRSRDRGKHENGYVAFAKNDTGSVCKRDIL